MGMPNLLQRELIELLCRLAHGHVGGFFFTELFTFFITPMVRADIALDEIATKLGALAGFAEAGLFARPEADMLPSFLANSDTVVVEEIRRGLAIVADDEPESTAIVVAAVLAGHHH